MSLKVFLPSLLVLALSACAVGPDYKTPATEAANITAVTDGAAGQKNFDRSKFEGIWWQQFDDPTLNQLVTQSLQGNRQLRVAFARWKAARAIRDDVSNDAMPTITSRASSDLAKGKSPARPLNGSTVNATTWAWTWPGNWTCSDASSATWRPATLTSKRLKPISISCKSP